VGKEAVRKGLVDGGGARVVGRLWERVQGVGGGSMMHEEEEEEASPEEVQGLVNSVMDALRALKPSSQSTSQSMSMDTSSPLNPTSNAADAHVHDKLVDVLGSYFANQVAGAGDGAGWAREILGLGL